MYYIKYISYQIYSNCNMWVGRSCGEQGLTYEPAKPVQVLFTDFPQASWVVFRSFFRVEKKKKRKCNYSSNMKFWAGKRKQAFSTTGRRKEEISGRRTVQPSLQLGVGDRPLARSPSGEAIGTHFHFCHQS
jgi:hypothetical protein